MRKISDAFLIALLISPSDYPISVYYQINTGNSKNCCVLHMGVNLKLLPCDFMKPLLSHPRDPLHIQSSSMASASQMKVFKFSFSDFLPEIWSF